MPTTDPRAFATVSYETARQLNGAVEKITPPASLSTFLTAVIIHGEHHQHRFALLCHRHLPLLALAEPPTGWGPVSIIDDTIVRAALSSQTSFQLLTTDELNTPLSHADLSGLAKAELQQIAAWKPHTVSELLFNHWD